MAIKKHGLKILGVLIAVGVLLIAMKTLPISEWLANSIDWVGGFGPLAPVLFVLIYMCSVIFFVPSTLFSLASGHLFGLWLGVGLTSLSSTLGASIAFLLGRHIFRERIQKAVSSQPKFAAISESVKKDGWKIVLLTRMSPIFPFALLNYGFGLTEVKFRDYFFGSLVGMLPSSFVMAYMGSICRGMCTNQDRSVVEWLLIVAGLIATITVMVYVSRKAKAILQQPAS